MAPTQKLYPRGTVKRIVKAHSNKSVSKNADILCACSSRKHYANSKDDDIEVLQLVFTWSIHV
ncbi:hypothetical protein N7478_007950 [Penicillium angulare]|uniref:uncharacterized protein n=1 Tax=Penicillium angulare TaxID=116970 RepID=UPI002541821B|nr:uncharacterized protein N7478_007950 [Penicillium angulare]KAJ5272825.1 hypothetical protein N7478_007950 [Penicillium angulare]